mmetsp:Transcript_3094/g.10263  ORF Transcript_3094/g.10263 Transcript_3094/m.10263 type:complete len:223 (+) Transcript_3094:2128-2796(+)
MVRQPPREAVRGKAQQGRREDGHEAAHRVALRSRAARRGDARHPRHDAGRGQGEQGEDDLAASLRGVAVLEGEHPVESPGLARADREHDLEVRQVQGGLVDERRALQPRTHSPRRHRRQDGVPEEPRAAHAAVAQGRARAPAQLPQGRAVRHPGGGGRDIHDDRALARVEEVFSDSVPAVVVQARQEAPHPRARTAQGELFHLRAVKPGATRGARAHRAGVR